MKDTNNINPIGLIGRFIPETEDLAWEHYANQHCVIDEATFFKEGGGELLVSFYDGVSITIQLEEFAVL